MLPGAQKKVFLPAGQPHHKQGDGHHVALVPVVLQVELDLLEDVDLLVGEEALGVDTQRPVSLTTATPLSQ